MLPDDIKTMPERFVWARKEKNNISQMALAEILGISQGSVEKLENGKVAKPKYLPEAAKILGGPYEWLLNNTQPADESWEQKQLSVLRELEEEERDRFEEALKFVFPDKFKGPGR